MKTLYKIRTTDGRHYTTEVDLSHDTITRWIRAWNEEGHYVYIQAINVVEFDDGGQAFDRKPTDRPPRPKRKIETKEETE